MKIELQDEQVTVIREGLEVLHDKQLKSTLNKQDRIADEQKLKLINRTIDKIRQAEAQVGGLK